VDRSEYDKHLRGQEHKNGEMLHPLWYNLSNCCWVSRLQKKEDLAEIWC